MSEGVPAKPDRVEEGLLLGEQVLVAAVQRPRDRLGDVAAAERLAEHVDDPC